MNIYNCKTWIADLDETIDSLPDLYSFENKTVLITGCTGLICSAVVDVLIRWNETHVNKIKILAAGRNEEKVQKRFSPFINEEWFSFVQYDALSSEFSLERTCDYIIHGASNASPNLIVEEPVETLISNIIGLKALLDYGKKHGTKRLLYISTSEVYGRKEHDRPSKVNEHGWIELLNPRSSYSIGKCAAETLCASYYDEYGVDSVIIRPGHIYGPTASKTDNRVASVWPYSIARGENIIMKSDGKQLRSYCYCLDSASAILIVLLKGESAHAYNISNPTSIIDIRRMAEILTHYAGVQLKIELPDEKEIKAFNPMNNSVLDSTELIALGWKGLFNAERGLSHTVQVLKELV